ncbi:MAG: hypothetical protein IJ480_04295 [Clostridia bacterium]|nr:hypothetical protein [Clostridia bacterium]
MIFCGEELPCCLLPWHMPMQENVPPLDVTTGVFDAETDSYDQQQTAGVPVRQRALLPE